MTPKKAKKDLLKVGRHTDYKKKYCEMLIEHRSTGRSYETFAAKVKCSVQTLYNWEKANPEFFEAKMVAYPMALAKWEDIGMAGTCGKIKGFNASSYIYTMKCMFRDTWTEKTEDEDKKDPVININISKDEVGL
jgi:hypothetical protein